jgi:ATP phosphoribosyltransferase
MGLKRRPSNGAAEVVSDDKALVLALPKGRIMKQAATLFTSAGFDLSPVFDGSRKLIFDCGPIKVLVVRSSDVPTYVAYGAADIGVAGRDVLDEQTRDLYEPLDLKIGACRMVVAEPEAKPIDESTHSHLRIATKYPVITRRYLEAQGITAEVIKLQGAVELGPLTGLADRIVDLVETGETMRQNGLVEVHTVMQITSRLVVNPTSLKLRSEAVSDLVTRLERAVARH